ncbi:glycosyltransferase family 2 protein [Clostridioides sp. ES-S-0108-01]|uniref:glycosyltransferase family 2 protein n=1 Tax=Clostridioides sp. ES-S-0108-01 TaxID=2770773 RepID=UPI00288B3EA4
MKYRKKLISVIIPCYNEEESIPIFYEEIKDLSKKMNYIDFEFIFIDDGSNDNSLKEIKLLKLMDSRTKYISFSRNFGKEAAMYAGLKKSNGNYSVIIDADLQHPPRLIEDMYKIINEQKCDCVATRRSNRHGEPIIRTIFSKLFYKIVNKISSTEIIDGLQIIG